MSLRLVKNGTDALTSADANLTSSQQEINCELANRPFDYDQYPETLTEGIPRETWDYGVAEAKLGMPIPEINDRLRDMEADLKELLKLMGAQVKVNETVGDLSRTVYGSDDREGLRARMAALEAIRDDWEGWWTFLKRSTIGAAIITAVGTLAAIFHFSKS